MGFRDNYNRRINGNTGGSGKLGDAYKNNTDKFINATFDSSPNFRVMEVVSTEFPTITTIDGRVMLVERLGSLREVAFRPNEGLNVGVYVKFDGETWLIVDKWGSRQERMNVLVQKCNSRLKWKDQANITRTLDCIVSAMPVGSKANQGDNDIEWNKYDVRLPTGNMFAFVEANALTRTLFLNQRFIFDKKAYEVYGIDETTYTDKNGYGMIQLTLKKTTIMPEKDDLTYEIAFNSYGSGATGGRLW